MEQGGDPGPGLVSERPRSSHMRGWAEAVPGGGSISWGQEGSRVKGCSGWLEIQVPCAVDGGPVNRFH